jgi:hypothetical protein
LGRPVNLEAGVLLDVGDGGLERMAVEETAVKRLGVGDELAALGAVERCQSADTLQKSAESGYFTDN